MLKALVVVVPVVLAIYCLVQVTQTRSDQVRTLPKWAWVVLILLFPLAGAVSWLLLGRERGPSPADPPRRGRPVAPDDDPDFLRGLHIDRPGDKPSDKPDDR